MPMRGPASSAKRVPWRRSITRTSARSTTSVRTTSSWKWSTASHLAGPLPLERALEFASQILSALDAAHRKGITHRDLKPDNILVTKQGVKLLDFGLAKLGASGAAVSVAQSLAQAPSESATRQQR